MDGLYGYTCTIIIFLLTNQICYSLVIVSLTIESYSNPNGTAYKESSSLRKCCDGSQRASCQVGDTCDTYFDVCVGSMVNNQCSGAFFHTTPLKDTNNISNIPAMESKSENWGPGTSIFVFINDDDSPSSQSHDHIDTLIQQLTFSPVPADARRAPHEIQWIGKTSLTVTLSAWCGTNYYGADCSAYCLGLEPVAWCSSTGKLTCSPSAEVLIEFRQNTSSSDFPSLDHSLQTFVKEQVCVDANTSQVQYPRLNTASNTIGFSAYCDNKEVSAFQLESLLNEKSDSLLGLYFPPGVVRGKDASIKDYGEHIVPNVHIGIEVLSAQHPAGTSFNGRSTSGERRCCDIPSDKGCQTAKDKCDMQFFVCIGQLIGDKCIGSVSISSVFDDTTSMETCGPTLLDYTQGKAYVSHPMIGAMRLTKRVSEIQVIVKDSDLGGNSSDIIDVLGGIVTITPGSDVTNASSEDIALKNVVSIKLRLLFWCAPGHSGPLCKADNGTDHCFPGWHGDECSIPNSQCSPNPCKNDATCSSFPDGTFKCRCTEGYNGTFCDKDIDECALHVCQHGATCQNLPGAFNCICSSGWDGLICTDKVPQCSPSPCQHGTCQPLIGTSTNYTCKCFQNWSGRYCSEKVTCSDASCIHGNCKTVLGEFFCICNQGYKGTNCTEDIDECQAKPCKHGGTCTNAIGNFSCACPSGFDGQICNITRASCPSAICNNHGNCIASSGGLAKKCACFSGFTGSNCETHTNYCQNVTCDNGGVCTEISNDYMCNCSKFWSGKTCDVDINECKTSPCQNGGTCKNIAGSYSCACPVGWTGTNCNTDVNECLKTQCKYGTCSNSPGSYKCVCSEGYFGQHCTFRYIYCKNVTCSGHGSCIEQINKYRCQCSPGYHGNDCELDVDECSQNVCKNNASACANSLGSYNCTCAPGWTGRDCSVDINECSVKSPIPCNGNGMCHNSIGSFKCQCFDGFIGSTCEVIIDDCKNLKCLNKGTCISGNDGPKCTCASGWEGIRCESDKNECEDDEPCYNYGACVNTDGSYYCNCYVGWTGSTCETDVDECLTPACQHGGVCSNLIGSFLCACKHGWQGMHCEVHLSESLTGSVSELIFKQNITSSQTRTIVSDLYQFLTKYVCKSKTPTLYTETVRLNTVRFQASCASSAVTKTLIQSALAMVPNVSRQFIFPLEVQEVRAVHVSTDTKSWISTNWPIFVGTFAALLAIFAVAFGCYRDRKRKRTKSDAFANPAFSEFECASSSDHSDLIYNAT